MCTTCINGEVASSQTCQLNVNKFRGLNLLTTNKLTFPVLTAHKLRACSDVLMKYRISVKYEVCTFKYDYTCMTKELYDSKRY